VRFAPREDLILENLALRQQLLALPAQRPRRRLTASHKVFWVVLCMIRVIAIEREYDRRIGVQGVQRQMSGIPYWYHPVDTTAPMRGYRDSNPRTVCQFERLAAAGLEGEPGRIRVVRNASNSCRQGVFEFV
jgi:hypothetical protein